MMGQILVFSIVLAIIASLAAATAYALYYQRKKRQQSHMYDTLLRKIRKNLETNLNILEQGDVGWRRLGHGQSTIRLTKIAPQSDNTTPVSLGDFKKTYPTITHKVKEIDADIRRIKSTADKVAKELEGEVKKQFHEDRKHFADVAEKRELFVRWLVDSEDAWMEVLATLINTGTPPADESDPGRQYWEQRKSVYMPMLTDHAHTEFETLSALKKRITRNSQSLLARIEDMEEK